jgi:hypothetical protein
MLHTSPETLPCLEIFNNYNERIIDDFKKYCKEVNVFYKAEDYPPTRHKYVGNGRVLHIWDIDNINVGGPPCLDHFPSIQELIQEINLVPHLESNRMNFAISDGKGRTNVHTDEDLEILTVGCPKAKLHNHRCRSYRALLAIDAPIENCYFYHLGDKKVQRMSWKVNQVFAFEKSDKHYTVNNTDLTRIMMEFDFWSKL